MPRASERRLKSAEDVRRALAWIFRQVESGRMDDKKARVLIYASSSLAILIRDTDLEARLEALEAAQKGEA
jgi:hypothetical protein